MFYCQVLVGDSQKCPKHNGNIRDTDYKDAVKRIKYESMTDFLQGSNVFVVYKNRRAYPLYLIKYRSKGGLFGFWLNPIYFAMISSLYHLLWFIE